MVSNNTNLSLYKLNKKKLIILYANIIYYLSNIWASVYYIIYNKTSINILCYFINSFEYLFIIFSSYICKGNYFIIDI